MKTGKYWTQFSKGNIDGLTIFETRWTFIWFLLKGLKGEWEVNQHEGGIHGSGASGGNWSFLMNSCAMRVCPWQLSLKEAQQSFNAISLILLLTSSNSSTGMAVSWTQMVKVTVRQFGKGQCKSSSLPIITSFIHNIYVTVMSTALNWHPDLLFK